MLVWRLFLTVCLLDVNFIKIMLILLGLIVEPPMPLPNKIDNANVNVDSKAEEKIDSSSSKPQNTENKDDKPLAANE